MYMPHIPNHTTIIPREGIYSASGHCLHCQTVHGLPMYEALHHSRELIHHFEQKKTIDLQSGDDSDPRLSTEYLFGKARGKMFGVLVCRDAENTTQILRAFSGQYNGLWMVDGWVPPLFDVDTFNSTNMPGEREIKALGRQLEACTPKSEQWHAIRLKRKHLSRELMQKLHGIYRLKNFRNNEISIFNAYSGSNGIPTGTGDCCGPKLLNYAANNNLIPVALAEFYWGLDNKSATKKHGCFYPSCREKCEPILGYMLCGLKDKK